MSSDPKKAVEAVVGDLTYEDRDIHLKGVVYFVLFTFVVVVISFFGMLATIQGLKDREVAKGVPDSPLAEFDRGIRTDVPMLQAWPKRELQAYLDREHTRLETSGEYTAPSGEAKYHIPVDHAMTLVLDELNQSTPAPAETVTP